MHHDRETHPLPSQEPPLPHQALLLFPDSCKYSPGSGQPSSCHWLARGTLLCIWPLACFKCPPQTQEKPLCSRMNRALCYIAPLTSAGHLANKILAFSKLPNKLVRHKAFLCVFPRNISMPLNISMYKCLHTCSVLW